MAELNAQQRERIAAQLGAHSGYICPDCLPSLSVEVIPSRWRLTVDHTLGCPAYAERLLQRALEPDGESGEELARALGLDRPPTPEELARWALDEDDPRAEEGWTP